MAGALNYATHSGFIYDPNKTLEMIYKSENDKIYYESCLDHITTMSINRLKIEVLRLLLMGEKIEEYDNIKKFIIEKYIPRFKPIKYAFNRECEKYICLLNKICETNDVSNLSKEEIDIVNTAEKCKCTKSKLVPGDVVGYRSRLNVKCFGIVTDYDEVNDEYRIITESHVSETFPSESIGKTISVYQKEGLESLLSSTPPSQDVIKEVANSVLSFHQQAEQILDLFSTVKPLELSEEDKAMINCSFPVVFASTTVKPTNTYNDRIKGENYIKGKAELGKDIQLAFTEKEYVPFLQKQLSEFGVEVLSFEAAHYIMSQHLEFHERLAPSPKSTL